MSFLFSSGLRSTIPDSGVARLTFDSADTSGSTAADVWNGNDGTINGATTGVSGQINEAYDFDGSDDYVALSSVSELQGASEFSISAWINWDNEGSGNNAQIIGQSNQFNTEINILHSHFDNKFQFRVNNGTEQVFFDTSRPNSGVWTLVTLTFNSGTLTGYYNDTEQGSNTNGNFTTSPSETNPFEIGRLNGIGHFDGRIDDVRIYSKELTATEVSNLYSTGSIRG